MAHPFSKKYAIVGLGVVTGRFPDRSARTLETEAVRIAIEDAGLKRTDIDGAINTRIESGSGESTGWTASFARPLGLPTNFYFTAQRGGAMTHLAVIAAAQMHDLGLAKYIVVG